MVRSLYAEDDMLQLSVRRGADGAGTAWLQANNKMEDTISKGLAILTDAIRSFMTDSDAAVWTRLLERCCFYKAVTFV